MKLFLILLLFFVFLSCDSREKRMLQTGLWAIEEVEIEGEVYDYRYLYDNLLSFEKNGKGSGFIFRNSPFLSNHFYWDFLDGGSSGNDSIEVHMSNNEFLNRIFQVDFYTKNTVPYLILTSLDVKIKCFKYI